jgi:ABC-2 type transport system permease protein
VSRLGAAIATEWLKARRSRIPWAITIGFSIIPLVSGLFMVILKDPEAARRLGLLGAKAELTAGTADWPTLFDMLTQAVAVGGEILFTFLTAWVVGREFADRTVRGLLAIPTPRWSIVIAKLIVIATWSAALSVWVLLLGVAIGALVGLPGWTADLATQAATTYAVVAVSVIALQSTTAFVAGAGRGYFAPLGWAVATVVAAQVLAILGWGAWFPWAIPAVLAGAGGPDAETVTVGGFALLALTAVIGVAASLAWWQRADQTG